MLHVNKKYLVIASVFIVVIILLVLAYSSMLSSVKEIRPAPDFHAKAIDGNEFNLTDFKGKVIVFHITSIENPVCIECEKEMKQQTQEIEKLSKQQNDIVIITINIRKNPGSDDGKTLAEKWWDVNVSWYWVEDFEPYPVANKYYKYWNVKGAFANPTIVLIDTDLNVVGVYHIYCMGRGEIDGIQDADSLLYDVEKIQKGEWMEFKGEVYSEGATFAGMFILGIITAFSPCSIALLISMLSYVGAVGDTNKKNNPKSRFNVKKSAWSGFWMGISFTLGLALIFFIFGCLISYIGFFIQVSVVFYLIAGIFLVILGINVVKPIKETFGNWLDHIRPNRKRVKISNQKSFLQLGGNMFAKISGKSVYLGAFFLGILFSIGWAPCAISLVLPVLILMLTQRVTILMGGLLLFVFGIGHGVPIIPLCTFTKGMRAKLGNKYVAAGKWATKIFGVIIIVIGVLMALRYYGIILW